ncbi:MAG: 8-amino-7-oxononanoate synthase [Aureliella sp.]
MPSSWDNFFTAALERAHRERRFRQPSDREDSSCDLGSNDYLGLSTHPEVIAAAEKNLCPRWGSGASPVIGGTSDSHRKLHSALASLAGSPTALSFSSGYATNVGVLSAIAGKEDVILSDQLNHASLIDGCRLSGAKRVIFPHRSCSFVADWLKENRSSARRTIIVTESVFSMDGDKAPIDELFGLANQYDCCFVVDEAHATGIYGEQGGGCLEELGLNASWPGRLIKLGTLSKAIGGIGGFVAGTQDCIDFLINYCRSYLFSTAAPPACAAAAAKAARLIPSLREERHRLRALSVSLRERLKQLGWQISTSGAGDAETSDSPIIPIVIGDAAETVRIAVALKNAGFSVPAIRPPTVPAGTSRLRISLSTRVSQADLDRFLAILGPRTESLTNK